MAKVYCGACRLALGHSRSLQSGPLLQSDYQRQKHKKHTVVDPAEPLQSVFSDPSTSTIRIEVEKALSSGPMEVDDRGRVNFLTLSVADGHRYESGVRVEVQDVTKVVLSSRTELRHEFPEASARLGQRCCVCGSEIFCAST